MRLLKVAAVAIAIAPHAGAQSPTAPSLQQLYERHSWFELRDAIAGRTVPALYAGAVSSAFNRTGDAEKYLDQAVRLAASAEAANEAREALANLYMRLARSADLVRVLDEAVAASPTRFDLRDRCGRSSRSAASRTNPPAPAGAAHSGA